MPPYGVPVPVVLAEVGMTIVTMALYRRAQPDLRDAFSTVGYRTMTVSFGVGLVAIAVGFLSILAFDVVRPATLYDPRAAYRWAWIGPFAVGLTGLSLGCLAFTVKFGRVILSSTTEG